jgi:hypothetical protein
MKLKLRINKKNRRIIVFCAIAVVIIIAVGIALYPVLFPPKPLLWGAFVGNQPGDLAQFEQLVGKSVDMKAYFIGWGDPFPTSTAAQLGPAGKTLVLFWEATDISLADISAGKYDEYMDQVASATAAYGGPVILTPFPEMNGDWNTWSGAYASNTPAMVIAAWQHIHDVFAAAPNVKFAWDVNNGSIPDTATNSIAVYYPGDAYVDYVAVDGFNFDDPWQSWSDVFSSALSQLSTYKKPIYILSMGSVPGPQKAQWITDGLGTDIKNYPQVAGWVWFNQNGADGDWLVDSDSSSLAAFQQVVAKYKN